MDYSDGGFLLLLFDLCRHCLVQDLAHRDAEVAFVVHAGAVLDQEYLWRFMLHPEGVGNLVGQAAIAQEVEIIEVYFGRQSSFLESLPGNSADGATGAVLENYLWNGI